MKHGITLPLAFFNQIHRLKTPNQNMHNTETRILMIECIYKKKLQLLINKNTLSVYKMIYYTYFTNALFQEKTYCTWKYLSFRNTLFIRILKLLL